MRQAPYSIRRGQHTTHGMFLPGEQQAVGVAGGKAIRLDFILRDAAPFAFRFAP